MSPVARVLAALALGLALPAAAAGAPARPAAPDAAGRAALARADSLMRAGRGTELLAHLEAVIAGARAGGDDALERGARIRRASWALFAGRVGSAFRDAARAESLAAAVRDTADWRLALRIGGFALLDLDRYEEAVPRFERLLAIGRRAGHREEQGHALRGLAYVDLERGRHRLARERYRRALALLAGTRDRFSWNTARIGLARALQEGFGAGDSARAIYAEVVAETRALGFSVLEAQATNNLGAIEFRDGDPALAVRHWRRALELHRARGGDPAGFLTPSVNLAVAYVHAGRPDEARALLESLAGSLGPATSITERARVFAQLASACLHLGDARAAAQHAARAVALSDSLAFDRADEYLVHLASARIASGEAARGAAEARAARARRGDRPEDPGPIGLAAEARCLLALGRAGEAAALLPGFARLRRGATSVWDRVTSDVDEARIRAASGDRAGALAAARRAADAWERYRASSRDPAWREARGNAGTIAGLLADLALTDPALGPAARARAAFDVVQRFRARAFLERVAGSPGTALPEARGSRADSLQRRVLRPGEVLLDYLVPARGDSALVIAIAPDRAVAARLAGRATLALRVQRFRDLVAPGTDGAGDTARTGPATRALAALVLGPVADAVAGARRVLVAPDGPLGALPFGLLPVPGDSSGVALAERAEVAVVPSAAFLARARASGARAPRGDARVVAVAGPSAAGAAPLPGAGREIAWLARRLPGAVARPAGHYPSAGAALRELSAADVVHVAAHTDPDDAEAWREGVRLGGAAGGVGEVTLRAEDIARSRFRARLGVLSGCRTYGPGRAFGEGPRGLGPALLAAGVPAVVATLWDVSDDLGPRFTRAFYERLALGLAPGAALRGAQAELRDDPESAAPGAWGAFVLLGDPTAPVGLPGGRP